MLKALKLMRETQSEHGGKNPRLLVCLQTGETAPTTEWARAIAEERKIKFTSAYGLLMRAIHKNTAFHGLNFRYADAPATAQQEEQFEDELEEQQFQAPLPVQQRQARAASPGMFNRRQPAAPQQPQMTLQDMQQKNRNNTK